VLRRLLPTEGEVAGLLALMCFTHARSATRADRGLVLLEDQDRQRWDRALIDEGEATLAAAPLRAASGPYRLQAEIAAAHTRAASAAATDWSVIASWYRSLLRVTDSPVVALNHAVAVSFADGPEAGLALVDELDGTGRLEGYHLLAATQTDLLRRLGRHAEARDAYGRALAAAPSPTERAFLQGRLDGLEPATDQ
jgi:RNA polymerase sigma-70 factor (ECF subfamily)